MEGESSTTLNIILAQCVLIFQQGISLWVAKRMLSILGTPDGLKNLLPKRMPARPNQNVESTFYPTTIKLR